MRKLSVFLVLLVVFGCSKKDELSEEVYQPQIVELTDDHRKIAITASDLSRVEELTIQILNYHKSQNTLVSRTLNPPIAKEEVRKLFSEFSCEPPEEIYRIWSIINGTSMTGSDDSFIWYHKLMSAEDSISKNKELRNYDMPDWNSDWFPIFEFQDEWYFFECTDTPKLASPIVFYFTESGAWYSYINLTTMLEFGAAVISQGLHKEDGEISYSERNRRLYEIHRKFNEGATFPYAVE
ncbi:hypothetical protein [Hahella sp. HN01]|uniref:hypothetical protein n=1 Tax=Hahella sp. HN01 TaxID=2847262 RepID=UPI001C1EC6E9|nr:hypothetical protein [Hahella sp. HN01]MBU6955941.1 hypothetical protein [Hahella sp. HN01]